MTESRADRRAGACRAAPLSRARGAPRAGPYPRGAPYPAPCGANARAPAPRVIPIPACGRGARMAPVCAGANLCRGMPRAGRCLELEAPRVFPAECGAGAPVGYPRPHAAPARENGACMRRGAPFPRVSLELEAPAGADRLEAPAHAAAPRGPNAAPARARLLRASAPTKPYGLNRSAQVLSVRTRSVLYRRSCLWTTRSGLIHSGSDLGPRLGSLALIGNGEKSLKIRACVRVAPKLCRLDVRPNGYNIGHRINQP